jgi:glycosyltransferase involved in cell wall biosynthesis
MKPQETELIRVLFMIAEYDRISGGQQSLLQLLRRLPAAGVEPLVCFPKEGRCSEAYRRAGIPIIIIPGPPMLTRYGQHLLRMSRLSALKIFFTQMLPYSFKVMREMRRRRASVLHCNSVRSLLFAGFVPRLLGYRVVWHVRGQLLPFGGAVRRAAESLATAIILVAGALSEEIGPKSRHKCRTIYNGIDEQAIPPNAVQPSLAFAREKGQPVIITIAAVTPFKGYHHLLAAARLVNQKASAAKPIFLCVGELFDKNYFDYLQGLIAEYRLDNIHFLGWQQNPFPYLQLADLVVLPTVEREQLQMGERVIDVRSGEGLPRSVLEAMYCGKPTVATTVAGTTEQILDGETGLLVPPSNPVALAQAILSLLEATPSARRQMGERAAARVRERFTTERMVRETTELYRELVGVEAPLPLPPAVATPVRSQAR